MTKQLVAIGSTANDGTGDPLRTAFVKTNDNFAEVYTLLGDGADLGTVVSSLGSGDNIDLSQSTGNITISLADHIDLNSVQALDVYGAVHGNGANITNIDPSNIASGSLPELDGSQLVDGLWTLGANGTSNYTFTGIGFTDTENDPDIYLARGRKYQFSNTMNAHPFRIQISQNGSTGIQYNSGVTNNDVVNGVLTFEVPFNAPDTLYYQCTSHTGMGGTIFVYPSLR